MGQIIVQSTHCTDCTHHHCTAHCSKHTVYFLKLVYTLCTSVFAYYWVRSKDGSAHCSKHTLHSVYIAYITIVQMAHIAQIWCVNRSTDGQLTHCLFKVGVYFVRLCIRTYWVRSKDESVSSLLCKVQCSHTIQPCPLYLVHLNSGPLLHIEYRPNHCESTTGQPRGITLCNNVPLVEPPCYTKAKRVRSPEPISDQVNQGCSYS